MQPMGGENCTNASSCHNYKPSSFPTPQMSAGGVDSVTPSADSRLLLISWYLQLACSAVLPVNLVTMATFTCCQTPEPYLLFKGRIMSSSTRRIANATSQLNSCVESKPHASLTIAGVTFAMNKSCFEITTGGPCPILPSSTHLPTSNAPLPQSINSTTMLLVVVIVVLALTAVIFAVLSTFMLLMTRRKLTQSQEFADRWKFCYGVRSYWIV